MALSLYHDTYEHTNESAASGHIVLLHGWGLNSLVWDELIPLLNTDYDITVIDLPGLGRSPMPGGDYNLEYLLAHVLAVAPQKAIWIGWSLGGLVVQKLAASNPEIVEAAVVISGSPKFVASDEWPHAMPSEVFEKFLQMLEEDWRGTLIRFLTLQCKNSESIKTDTKKLREMLFHHGLPAGKALREGLRILLEEDLRAELATTKTPMAYILGERDNLIPQQIEKHLQEIKPDLPVDIVAGASHVPHLSHTEQTVNAVRGFLEKAC